MKQEIYNAVRAYIKAIPKKDDAVPAEIYEKSIEALAPILKDMNDGVELSENDKSDLLWDLESFFITKLHHDGTFLGNPEVQLWFDEHKTDFNYNYWNAYKDFLAESSSNIPQSVIDANEKIIDGVLDYSGDPRKEGNWHRKGMVMGNVQSGKTLNYIGLINKAADVGYKTFILIGGHMNDLRKQTQERIDEGFIGKASKHLRDSFGNDIDVGVGLLRHEADVNYLTSTESDFNSRVASATGITLRSDTPTIFVIKKNTKILENLYKWIKENHSLDPENNKRLKSQLMFIDDEADYATPNSKASRDDISKTPEMIRKLINLFERSTYVGYSATPFANIFMDPFIEDRWEGDNLFPSDFMVRVPTPENYAGQNFYFEGEHYGKADPVIIIDDNESMLPYSGHKKSTPVGEISKSLKESILAFIISNSIRNERGHGKKHKTMMVNITHLNALQQQITWQIEEYKKEIEKAVRTFSNLSNYMDSQVMQDLKDVFEKRFDVPETFADIKNHFERVTTKIKVFGVNAETGNNLDYSLYKENGLSAIVIGGHKLSRGLTLEGLSITYFARNSKAYDTLMQMCRWFGYRDGWKDVCKVYMPIESYDHYNFISGAINDLYLELERMKELKRTPSDFGLKVKEHPGALLVTARNRMENAVSDIVKIGFHGQRIMRFRFKNEADVNLKNLKIAERFLSEISQDSEKNYVRKSLIIDNVEHDSVIDLINNLDLPEDRFGNKALINHIKSLKDYGLENFKVALFNQESTRKPNWMNKDEFKEEASKAINQYDFFGESINTPMRAIELRGEEICGKSSELGNSGLDEGLFLNERSFTELRDRKEKAPRAFISGSVFDENDEEIVRNFPGLIIYLFSVSYKTSDAYCVPFDFPCLGLSLSFPILEAHKDLSSQELKELNEESKTAYKTNAVYQQMEMFIDEEE